MNFIDTFLNRITMYRTVLYGLTILAVYALVLSAFGVLGYSLTQLLISLLLILAVSYGANTLLAKLFGAVTNVESVWITAFILFFTLGPVMSIGDAAMVALACTLAMASKFFIAIRKKHIFNPAAFALATLSLLGSGLATWWVASPVMFPLVLIVGLLVVRKIRRFDSFIPFVIASLVVFALFTSLKGGNVLSSIGTLFLSWPIVFMGTIMLTEPQTLPPSRGLRMVHGIIVGALFASPVNLASIYMSPELALLFGNIYAYFVSSKQKLMLRLKSKTALTPTMYEFVFTPSEKLVFQGGQYLEWTMPLVGKIDTRGNRRYFTIASSPDDNTVRLGVRMSPENPSSFKKALMAMPEGSVLTGGSLAGDFVLPRKTSRKLAFVAGGVGITPFASMIRGMLDQGQKRDISLLYLANTDQDFAYRDEFNQARALGVSTQYIAGKRLDESLVQTLVPDYRERLFYLSGPNVMVEGYKTLLISMGVHRSHIKTDYFPGF